MPVVLASKEEDYMLNGEYDVVVAQENQAKYFLECDDCGLTAQGTMFDLEEADWSWQLSINNETLQIVESKATCPKCNGEKTSQETSSLEKAAENPKQKTIGEIV